MNYKFYFKDIYDAEYFYNRVVEMAKNYDKVRLSDLYDLTGKGRTNYLTSKYIWTKDTILFDVIREFDIELSRYYVEFPEPDHYPDVASVTPRSSVFTKETSQTAEPINITILTENIENVNEIINKVIERANQIKDRPVFITIS